MKLLIRVDGNTKMGLGHLMRCMAMAELCTAIDIEVLFVCRTSTLPFFQNRQDWIWKSVTVPDSLAISQEPEWIQQIIVAQNISAILLDGYQFDEIYRKTIFDCTVFAILMDDNNDSGLLYCDMVINSSPNARDLGYERTCANGIHCLGSEYRVLRQEFHDVITTPFSERNGLSITFGGSDPFNFTVSIIKLLKSASNIDYINVITGAAFIEEKALSDAIQGASMPIYRLHNHCCLAKCFSQSRLVISAAGGTQFELLACHAPSVLVVVADNQLNAANEAARQGWCEMVDARKTFDREAFTAEILALWNDKERLNNMMYRAASLQPSSSKPKMMDVLPTVLTKHLQERSSSVQC